MLSWLRPYPFYDISLSAPKEIIAIINYFLKQTSWKQQTLKQAVRLLSKNIELKCYALNTEEILKDNWNLLDCEVVNSCIIS